MKCGEACRRRKKPPSGWGRRERVLRRVSVDVGLGRGGGGVMVERGVRSVRVVEGRTGAEVNEGEGGGGGGEGRDMMDCTEMRGAVGATGCG